MSEAEPTPLAGSSLLARLGWAVKDKVLGRGDEERSSDAVKLVHAEDLHSWDRFPRCQDFDGITFGQYRAEAYQLERRRRSVASLIAAIDELDTLDTDETVEYDFDYVEVPRRGRCARPVRLPLPRPRDPAQRPRARDGDDHGRNARDRAGLATPVDPRLLQRRVEDWPTPSGSRSSAGWLASDDG